MSIAFRCTGIGLLVLLLQAIVLADSGNGGTPGYYYVDADLSIANLVAGRAKITCTPVQLCTGIVSQSVAHVYIQKNLAGGDQYWSEIGWLKSNYQDWDLDGIPENTVERRIFYWIGNTVLGTNRYRWGDDPGDDGTNYYLEELNPSTGEWVYYIDGAEWENYTSSTWNGNMGDNLYIGGEIYTLQTDMPGISTAKCSFNFCAYRRIDDEYLVSTNINSIYNDDNTRWGDQINSGTDFDIWDKSPIQ
jgi:hypothetical protein